uniref:Uncharacterized protein LOC110197136 isoform X3 n=1 Tax=Phascolarctos cinereus TaxID=38626 RepID=A0A6P5IWD8_PHACI|nr:uncharacterized protein LOC110197136 isoform X3 [Phascolarctos cinereus]
MRGEKAPLDLDFKGEYRRPARTELNRYIRLRRRKCQGQRSAAGHPPIPATGSHGCQPQGRCKGQTQADPHISWGPALQIPDGDRDSGCVDECFGAARSPAQGLQPLLGPALPRPASSSSAARGVCNEMPSVMPTSCWDCSSQANLLSGRWETSPIFLSWILGTPGTAGLLLLDSSPISCQTLPSRGP